MSEITRKEIVEVLRKLGNQASMYDTMDVDSGEAMEMAIDDTINWYKKKYGF